MVLHAHDSFFRLIPSPPDAGDCVSNYPETVSNDGSVSAEPGKVIVLNTCRMAIWYVTAMAGSGESDAGPDLLKGALMPGAGQCIDVPAGTYRLRAETGGGTVYRSPLLRVDPGGVARWSIAAEGDR